jgi:hypothetical protein
VWRVVHQQQEQKVIQEHRLVLLAMLLRQQQQQRQVRLLCQRQLQGRVSKRNLAGSPRRSLQLLQQQLLLLMLQQEHLASTRQQQQQQQICHRSQLEGQRGELLQEHLPLLD